MVMNLLQRIRQRGTCPPQPVIEPRDLIDALFELATGDLVVTRNGQRLAIHFAVEAEQLAGARQ